MADTLPIPVAPSRMHWRARLYRALISRRVDRFVTLLVVVNAVILGMLTYDWQGPVVHALVGADSLIATIFVVEIALKLVAGGTRFLRRP